MRHQTSHPDRTDSDPDGFIAWRMRRLERAGFDTALAAMLARDRRTDIHALLDLVDRGCPAHLAARILAPLEDPPQ